MKRIRIKQPVFEQPFDFWPDCERIVNVFMNNGLVISLTEAKTLWELYSDSLCASWLVLPKSDNNIIDSVKPWFEEIEE